MICTLDSPGAGVVVSVMLRPFLVSARPDCAVPVRLIPATRDGAERLSPVEIDVGQQASGVI